MPAMDYDRVAHLYDAYVQTELDVPFFLEEARKTSGPVLELMCGTGRVSTPLLDAGTDLTCVDSSAEMLNVFRGKLRDKDLSAELIEANVCRLSLNRRFNLIFIPFHSFAEITDPAQRRQALQVIRTHLAPQGRFICTLHNPPCRLKWVTGQSRKLGDFSLRDGNTLTLSSVETYDATSGCVSGTQFYEVRRRNGMVVARMAVDLRFRLHSCCEFRSLAEAAGFVPVALYGDYSRASFEMETSPFMIWIFRKAETGAACEGQRAFE
ncbi:MAG TPA: class I SAM-dependent methyltransferase [Sedimentisphaerales bacterium]|jgi:SAM-dependent methyltransferase|nr:class I SAM-dependent methyltransferase [Sedimentisphaerales bacterium]HNU28252.1 class I SAM-dependent methyltransferase [Sedimentisphaerales bacterium]